MSHGSPVRRAWDVSPLMVTRAIHNIPTFIVLPLVMIHARELNRVAMRFTHIENGLFYPTRP